MKFSSALCTLAAVAMIAGACGDDGPTEPSLERSEVAGTYALTVLSFDPQGSLPAVDLHARLGDAVPPRITLTTDGQVQFLVQDPVSDLALTVNGTYTTTSTGVRITFSGLYADLLLSRTMHFSWAAGTLTFSGAAADGVSRARLLVLFPELEGEQLLDPVPGQLTVTATRGG